jgi:hypothetical protein
MSSKKDGTLSTYNVGNTKRVLILLGAMSSAGKKDM